ncbi:MAG: hypothetical protein NTY27_05730 [Actinobacteria bacterium]|nr:hypothetical protein [Actinomycetota bacterium]
MSEAENSQSSKSGGEQQAAQHHDDVTPPMIPHAPPHTGAIEMMGARTPRQTPALGP